MATLRQYKNIPGRIIILAVILLISFLQLTRASENYFVEVKKNTNLENFVWTQRPIVIFANSQKDPNFISQIEFLSEDLQALEERDIVVLVDTNPSNSSLLRKRLRPHGFAFILIGKDGQVKLRTDETNVQRACKSPQPSLVVALLDSASRAAPFLLLLQRL